LITLKADKKLINYALDPNNTNGGSDKARVFQSALGFNQSNANQLMSQVRTKLPHTETTVVTKTEYGQTFQVDMEITGVNGKSAIVRTGWIIRNGSDHPDLTTIYVKGAKQK
jgi:hypothetical protein